MQLFLQLLIPGLCWSINIIWNDNFLIKKTYARVSNVHSTDFIIELDDLYLEIFLANTEQLFSQSVNRLCPAALPSRAEDEDHLFIGQTLQTL